VTSIAARRRHPLVTAALVLLGLVITGVVYAAVLPGEADAAASDSSDVAAGRSLFLANCSTCHGVNAEGRNNAPSLVGVGAAAVDFQVGTGRMPLAQSGPQAPQAPVRLNNTEIRQLAEYVASLAPGPAIPDSAATDPSSGDPSKGNLIFRTNCAMCHNAVGRGGALTRGKYAPDLSKTSPTHIYEAMTTGPQSMPVFNDQTLDPQSKRDVIAYLTQVNETPNPGGFSLGRIGPVSEGLVGWIVGIGLLIGSAVWLGSKAA
jgi:ubiquinol-cytochrome c reductase cytochrome c subunit